MKFVDYFDIFFLCISVKSLNAREARDNEFPFIVSLRRPREQSFGMIGDHLCCGIILDKSRIITAAQCLYNNISFIKDAPIYAIGGTNHLTNYSRRAQKIKKYLAVIHPDYRLFDLRNDIAFIRMAQNFYLDGKLVKRIEISEKEMPHGTICAVAGWGSPTENFSVQLRTANVTIISRDKCQEIYWSALKFKLGKRTICGNSEKGSICTGEIGGPLVCNKTLYGTVSRITSTCNDGEIPTLFFNVQKVKDFVLYGLSSGDSLKPLIKMYGAMLTLLKSCLLYYGY